MIDSFALAHVPGVTIVDVLPGVTEMRLRQLQTVHQRWFPDHPHVVEEMAAAWVSGRFDPDIAVHQWLLLHDDVPCGLFIFHVNLRLGIVLRHFLAMDEQVRAMLADDWVRHLIAACEKQAEADAAAEGVQIYALMSEIGSDQPRLLAHWGALGHQAFPKLGYQEPYHGKHWADHGEPVYFPMIANIYLTPAGRARPVGEVIERAVRAFLVDHYRLSPEHPVVAGILTRARNTPDPPDQTD